MDFQWVVDRAKKILLDPKGEWPVIASEEASIASLYQRYILLLAALPALAGLIKSSLLGYSVPFMGTVRVGFGAGLSGMLLQYLLTLVVVFLLALLIDALANSFGGEKNQIQAMKTATYAMTAAWVGGALIVVPWIGWFLSLLGGVYALYLLYLGLHHTMRNPREKSLGYAAVTIFVAIVLQLIIGAVVSSATGMGDMMHVGPGAGSDMSRDDAFAQRLEEAGKRMEAASKQMEQAQASGDADAQADAAQKMLTAVLGGGDPVESLAPEKLKALIPETLAGMARSTQQASRSSAMGIQVSNATAEYSEDERSLNLDITDTGGAMAMLGLADWAGIQHEEESDAGYVRSYKKGGRSHHEQWNQADAYGEYSVIVGGRFIVKLEGRGLEMAALKDAMGDLDLDGLEQLHSKAATVD